MKDDDWWLRLEGALATELQQYGFDPDAYLLRLERKTRQVTLRIRHHHPHSQLNFQLSDEYERKTPEELAERMVEAAAERPGQPPSEIRPKRSKADHEKQTWLSP